MKQPHVLVSMLQKRPNVFPPPPDIIAKGIKLVSRIAAGTAGGSAQFQIRTALSVGDTARTGPATLVLSEIH